MAAKLFDGLFLGDDATSQDPEFLELNKISNLVNLAGREVPNVYSGHGLVYFSLLWDDRVDFQCFRCVDTHTHTHNYTHSHTISLYIYLSIQTLPPLPRLHTTTLLPLATKIKSKIFEVNDFFLLLKTKASSCVH